jgi:hypothetical protein
VLAESIYAGKHIVKVETKQNKHEEGGDHHHKAALKRKETQLSINILEIKPLILNFEVG